MRRKKKKNKTSMNSIYLDRELEWYTPTLANKLKHRVFIAISTLQLCSCPQQVGILYFDRICFHDLSRNGWLFFSYMYSILTLAPGIMLSSVQWSRLLSFSVSGFFLCRACNVCHAFNAEWNSLRLTILRALETKFESVSLRHHSHRSYGSYFVRHKISHTGYLCVQTRTLCVRNIG